MQGSSRIKMTGSIACMVLNKPKKCRNILIAVFGMVTQVGNSHKDPVYQLEKINNQADYATHADASNEGKKCIGSKWSYTVWACSGYCCESSTDIESTDEYGEEEISRDHD